MKIIKGDIFQQTCDALCIPSCGYIEGAVAIPGIKGVEYEASRRWSGLRRHIGLRVMREGNSVYCVSDGDFLKKPTIPGHFSLPYHIVNFPTRPSKVYIDEEGIEAVLPEFWDEAEGKKWVPGYMARTNLAVVRHSLDELLELTKKQYWSKVCLPAIGGGRKARELLDSTLDDRFVVVAHEEKNENGISYSFGPSLVPLSRSR